MSDPLPRVSLAIGALAVVALLAACTASPGTEPMSPRPTPSSSPAALGCADLADEGTIGAAIGGAAAAVDPVATMISAGVDAVAATAIPAAGGLQCAWRGAPISGFTPVLTALLLPDPDARWTGMLFGDAPATATRTFGSHTVVASSGDPGFGATARIGGTWVFLERTFPPEATGDPGADHDLDAAFTAIFDAAAAEGARLAPPSSPADPSSPSASPATGGATADCEAALDSGALGAALGAPASYVAQPARPELLTIQESAMQRVGDLDCFAGSVTQSVKIVRGHGRAAAVAQLKPGFGDAAGITFAPAKLAGLTRKEWAVDDGCTADSACAVIFVHGGDLYEVDYARGSVAVAEALIAQDG
ncbi:hypothetical protein [Schumannella soli]|uniref:DUF3558 domain-containing protein n=1 Tax=Schumannella soli TaxID=2590779 RepID=A0A506XTQ0_9MICO|nr:hypothetical protein [Schumannella soli]TPW76204.1 hypothetical protein FJ657_10430 [Schumannella soli]